IRLRGPWDVEPLQRQGGGAVPAKLRMTLPCRWAEGGLADFAGKVRHTRQFGIPTNLEPHERLWLTFAGVSDSVTVWLNGKLLGEHRGDDAAFEFEVTGLLAARNTLVVEVECANLNGGLWGEVALEIRSQT